MKGNAELQSEPLEGHRLPVPRDRKAEAWKELEHILNGASFRTSRRGQLLLRYLVSHTLDGDCDRIKERTIGVELFGRDASYDTGQDSIVRVAANDVRKRLAEHYGRGPLNGIADAPRISIPHGSYVPEFHFPEPKGTLSPVVMPTGGAARATRFSTERMVLLSLVLGLVLLSGALAVQNRSLRIGSFVGSLPEVGPWPYLANPAKRVTLIVADSAYGAAKEILAADFRLPEYTNGFWAEQLHRLHPEASILQKVPLTSITDAVSASKISGMLERAGYSTVIRSPRSIQVSDFKTDHPIVMLGSANANPWVELLHDHLNFRIEFNPKLGRQICVNAAPQANEQPVYYPTARTGSAGIAYATISLVPNLSHSSYILILAGSNMEGTEAAVEFVTDIPRLKAALHKRGIEVGAKLEQVELLMRVECMNTASGRSEIIAHRITRQ